jgi:hypothetical protein
MPQQRPKKQDNVEGRIIIGQNINWALPQQLRNLVSSPIAADRRVALDDLARLHGMGNDVVRGSVRDVIRELTDDDSKLVSAAATTLLQTGHLEPFMDTVQRPVHQVSNGPAMSEPTAKRGREGPMASRPTPALPQRRVAVIRAHKKWGMTTHVMDVAFSPDGRLLASSGLDGAVRLWNPITHRPASRPLTSHNGLGWSPAPGCGAGAQMRWRLAPTGPCSPAPLMMGRYGCGTRPPDSQPAPRSPTYMLAE